MVLLAMQVLAAATDATVRVWDASTGHVLQVMAGHKQMAHVLECHPWNPRLAFSAGYDGQLIIWDVDQGQLLRR
jgi:WD40 repeat protein